MANEDIKPLKGWKEISAYVGSSTKVAREFLRQGMPISKIGGRVYGLPEDINEWIRSHRKK